MNPPTAPGSGTLAVGLSCVASILLGACRTPDIKTRYKPLHPASDSAVDFGVAAQDGDGIVEAELFLYEYELAEQNGALVATQRPGGTWGLVKAWTYPSDSAWDPVNSVWSHPKSIVETHTHAGFPAGTNFVRYLFRVTDAAGFCRSEAWSFAVGDWAFGNEPIPILVNAPPDERINVYFIADRGGPEPDAASDYASASEMLPDLEGLIFDGYHVNNALQGPLREYWQFYYSPETGHIPDYYAGDIYDLRIPTEVYYAAMGQHDCIGIIHSEDKWDWAEQNVFGTEPYNIGTALHESGHVAFNLGDENELGDPHASPRAPDTHPNTFDSEAKAASYNAANGWPASDVEVIHANAWWRPEPKALGCIMFQDGDAAMPDFARTCIRRAHWTYSQL